MLFVCLGLAVSLCFAQQTATKSTKTKSIKTKSKSAARKAAKPAPPPDWLLWGGANRDFQVDDSGLASSLAGWWPEKIVEPRARRRVFRNFGGERRPLYRVPTGLERCDHGS
jgi:hypothetical protein